MPKPNVPTPTAEADADPLGTLFAGLFGLLLGIGLLKWGNPVILDRLVEWPRTMDEWRAFAWPVRVGLVGLLVVAGVGGWLAHRTDWRPAAPRWIVGSLVGWLIWQGLAAVGSLDPDMTRAVLAHFVACTICFFLGHLALSRVAEPRVFWLCLVLGFLGVLGMASDQHFGGLEATRKMILESPDSAKLGLDQLARIRSNRVFSTLVYPNALAGAVLLLLPLTTVLAGRWGATWGEMTRRGLALAALLLGLAVLLWSGSKTACLIALGLGLFLVAKSSIPGRFRIAFMLILLICGLTGLRWMFAEKLQRGATSVSARFDYWQAAWGGVRQAPWFGNGPGAFKKVYAAVKRPESEMAQLTHNDYWQQACDSGWPGFLLYLAFVLGSLIQLYRNRHIRTDGLAFATWMGLAAWFTHGLVEFGLYIPATSWVAFALLGWLLALQKPSASPAA